MSAEPNAAAAPTRLENLAAAVARALPDQLHAVRAPAVN